MDYSFWFDTINLDSPLWVSGYNLKKNVFFSLKIFSTLTNSVDPDEMPLNAAFHLGFTVCKSTHLGVSPPYTN